MKSGAACLVLVASLQAGSPIVSKADGYPLPATKAYIEPCKRAALEQRLGSFQYAEPPRKAQSN